MKQGKRILTAVLAATFVLGSIGNEHIAVKAENTTVKNVTSSSIFENVSNTFMVSNMASAAEKETVKNISIKAFAKKLEKAAGLENGTLIRDGEFDNMKANITWTQAAVLTNRADELKNGTDYDKDLYKEVVDGKRITGLTGLSAEEKKAVRLCFVKGIISGDSKGKYSQSRAFRANDKITTSEAHKILVRLENEKKRVKLSPDGQVIRTTNLPKNYKKYDYILASFPNEFYERKFDYEMTNYYYEPKNLEDYASPKDIKRMKYQWSSVNEETGAEMVKNYSMDWLETIRTNLEYRFNFDYRTVDDKWLSKLASTYIYSDNAEWNITVKRCIQKYIETAKKNRVIVKADKIVIEPSTLYYSNGEFYVRCYLKFKVNADKIYGAKLGQESRQHELIFSGYNCVILENLQNNKWIETVIDISIGQSAGNQKPATYSIQDDQVY